MPALQNMVFLCVLCVFAVDFDSFRKSGMPHDKAHEFLTLQAGTAGTCHRNGALEPRTLFNTSPEEKHDVY
jgi:hypothetical protein